MGIHGTYGTMFFVADMKAAAAFYATKLGLAPRYESDEWTEFDLGDGTAVCLHRASPEGHHGVGGIPILRVTAIRELVASLEGQGVKITRPVFEVHPGAYGADIEDQGGHALHLYEPPR
jgi:catechol 2,3-dioxygenase-like lactoylglutathione lyase family enzyme